MIGSAGVLYVAASELGSVWLAITTPSRDSIFDWDHLRARCLPVEERIDVAVHVGDPEAFNLPPVSRAGGLLLIDTQDLLSLRMNDSQSRQFHALSSIAVDAALVGAIALTYPRDRVLIRSPRAWSVLYRARSVA